MKRPRGLAIFALVMMAAAVVSTIGSVLAIRERNRLIDYLMDEQAHLQDENSFMTVKVKAALAEVTSLKAAVEAAYQPKPIQGTVDFPIMRAMAMPNDSLAGFAKRESTTAEIVKALNPWLGDTTKLSAGQSLWVPKNNRLLGRDGAVTPQ